jgi:sialate O-acetylesterase
MRKNIVRLIAIGLLESHLASANVRLPALIGDNMVLQRDAKITLWGWADPGERIEIDFHGKKLKSNADRHGRWSIVSGPFAAGGPFDVVVTGKNRLELHNVLMGDVWLASGQSNMEFPLKHDDKENFGGALNASKEIAGADYPEIRLLKVHHKVAWKPLTDVDADAWTAVTPQTAGSFSAVAYLFGRELHQRYRVPIGLIESVWGGTVAEAWISEGALKKFPEFDQDIASLKRLNESNVAAEYQQYVERTASWDKQHADDDRGQVNDHAIWAATALDTAAWPTVVEPQMRAIEALKGFDGVVWFRKDLELPAEDVGKDLIVHLTNVCGSDSTFFNGARVGETPDAGNHDYPVPGNLVKAGRNVIAVRTAGSDGFVGMDGDRATKLSVEIGGQEISLEGPWSYQPGPDLAAFPAPSAHAKWPAVPNTATLLFNGMLAPLTPYRIKGVIWYQGEGNADRYGKPSGARAAQYRTLFPALIADWRRSWGYEFPFLFVQLAGFRPNEPEPAEYPWADLREAQAMALDLPATAMATAVDIGDMYDIHPRDKQDVAHRLALAAAKVAYGESLIFSGPTYQSMSVEGGRIRIKYSGTGAGLVVKDNYGYLRGFEIAGSDGKFVWAQAAKDGDDIVVFNEAIGQPNAVRYDWSNTPDGNLFNKEGLPAPPFRTDSPQRP